MSEFDYDPAEEIFDDVSEMIDEDDRDDWYDDSMDGDHASALASIGWGTDEDYGYYGDDFF